MDIPLRASRSVDLWPAVRRAAPPPSPDQLSFARPATAAAAGCACLPACRCLSLKRAVASRFTAFSGQTSTPSADLFLSMAVKYIHTILMCRRHDRQVLSLLSRPPQLK
ncbi:hypothetical protein R1flu_027593 [Riccia fluitans]|uniref:Uncharacterized protein n=1 Tax=Riccia fluitans TaxID=41844 RepID=A0ABD1XJ91_9MARC